MGNISYRTAIRVKDENNSFIYYEADLLREPQEHLATDITHQPMVNGDMLADHRIIQPMTIQLTGKFSLNGANNTDYNYEGYGRLASIEKTFEDIMKNGTLCDIVVLSKDSSNEYTEGQVRFLTRFDMALTSIDWTRGVNDLQFSFGFVQVQVVNVSIDDWLEDHRDPNLPALTEPQVLDFTETLLNYDQIDALIVKMCQDCGLLGEGFLQFAATVCNDAAKLELGISIGSGIASGIALSAALTSTAIAIGASATVPVVGWVLAGTLALASLLAYGLSTLFSHLTREANKKLYKIKQFQLYESDRENQAEVERFINFVGSIHQQLEKLEDVLSLYKISTNEAQECMLYIDDNYYIFNFTENYASSLDDYAKWSMNVKSPEEKIICKDRPVIGLGDISECTSSNALFRTVGQGNYVYLINTKQQEATVNGQPQSVINEAINDLSNYYILISKINMDDYTSVLTDIIKNAIEA